MSPAAPHILVFPFPAQGHMIPMLDLAAHLSARGCTITVLVTTATAPLLQPSAAFQTLVFPLPPHPSLPPGVEQVRDLPHPFLVAALMQSLAALRPQILTWARSHPNPPSALLSEFFLGWTHHLAADLAIPRLAFYSTSATLDSVLDRLFRHHDRSSLPYAHLPSLYKRYAASAGAAEWEFVRDSMLANRSSWGAVFNTFEALEGPHLARQRADRGAARVWAVGPIAPAVPAAERGGQSSGEVVSAWLDARPPRSVVYVCFGSQFSATAGQAAALAAGIERSGARFVWAVGRDAEVVPDGFEGRTEERGMVIKGWAPQVAILGHAAVGAFLTHCGWNSTLEGLAAGVALVAWPMEADQFVNARLLVEELGVAVRACEGGGSVPDAEELAAVLRDSVAEGTWPEVRARAADMGRRAAEAVAEGGSSFKQMDDMVRALSEFKVKS